MRILVIADLHGLNVWKNMVNKENFDRVIFLWDYVDSFTVSDNDVIKNLTEIIEYKKNNREKVILLLWNHDIQYIWGWNWCSWYRSSYAWVIGILFKENIGLFKVIHKEWGFLFSHAWITKKWLEMVENKLTCSGIEINSEDDFNKLLWSHFINLLFSVWSSRGWKSKASWPLWADKSETENIIDWGIEWLTQVVWHSKVPSIVLLPHIIYCDCLEYWDWKPLILEYDEL